MWCVIPVAGEASRLRGMTKGRPKSLLKVHGRSILDRLIERLPPGVSDICLIVSTEGEAIRSEVGDELHGRAVHYAIQPEPVGVADAIGRARDQVRGPFLVVMGDVFYGEPLAPYLGVWERSGADGAVLVEPLSPADGTMGLVWLEEGRVVGIRKGRYDDRADARVCGMCVLPHAAIELCGRVARAETGESELEDVIAMMLESGAQFAAVPFHGWRRNINTQDEVFQVEDYLASVIAD